VDEQGRVCPDDEADVDALGIHGGEQDARGDLAPGDGFGCGVGHDGQPTSAPDVSAHRALLGTLALACVECQNMSRRWGCSTTGSSLYSGPSSPTTCPAGNRSGPRPWWTGT